MTPIFSCGFECGVFDAGAHWVVNSGTPGVNFEISTSTVRSGSRSFRCFPIALTEVDIFCNNVYSGTRHIGRCYLRFATLPTGDCSLVFYDTSGPAVRFKASDSKLYAAVGSNFGASGVSVTTGVWYRLDWDFNVNTAGTDFCDVQVDGTACGQVSGTGSSQTRTFDLIGMNATAATTADMFFDDVVLSETAADYPIGAGYVNHFVPTADGTHNIAGTGDFQRGDTGTDILNATTTAYQLADDVPLPSGTVDQADNIRAVAPLNATDYVECVFGPAPGIDIPTAPPRAVDAIAAHHQLGTQTGNTRIGINDNGTINDLLNLTAAGVTSYSYARKNYTDPPSAASAWSIGGGGDGDFTDLRVRFYSSDAAPDTCLDGIMVEAEFAEVLGQFARPSADSVDGSWTPSTGSDLYAVIDESVANDSDYAFSGAGPAVDAATVQMSAISTPQAGDVILKIRSRKGS